MKFLPHTVEEGTANEAVETIQAKTSTEPYQDTLTINPELAEIIKLKYDPEIILVGIGCKDDNERHVD